MFSSNKTPSVVSSKPMVQGSKMLFKKPTLPALSQKVCDEQKKKDRVKYTELIRKIKKQCDEQNKTLVNQKNDNIRSIREVYEEGAQDGSYKCNDRLLINLKEEEESGIRGSMKRSKKKRSKKKRSKKLKRKSKSRSKSRTRRKSKARRKSKTRR